MIHHNYKKHLFFTAFAAILSIVLMAVSDTTVKSQRAVDAEPSPYKFKLPPAPKNHVPNITQAPASTDGLKWTTDFSSSESANAVAVRTDGKIVVAGTATVVGGDTNYPGGGSSYAGYDFVVFRYNADGSLDTSFSGDGKVTTSFGSEFGSNEAANAVAIQSDGKIIAAGSVGADFALVRFNSDGSFDNSFGSGGKVITETRAGGIREIAVQSNGKIVAAGGGGELAVARYNADGSLDNSFGTGGMIQLGTHGAANTVAVQANGSIVVAGSVVQCVDNGDFEPPTCFDTFLLVRYNPNGSPDTSFNGGGLQGVATAVAVQADGKIITATSGNGFNLARYNQDGSLDPSFDSDGRASINISNDGYANTVVIQPDGKIIVSGPVGGTAPDFALARLNPDGSLDTSFDGDGKLMTDFGSSEAANSVAIQADGKIVAAGYSGQDGYDSNSDFALSRYNADGSLDAAFDGDGKLTTSFRVVSSAVNAIVGSHGSTSLLAGYANNGVNDDFAVCNDGNGYGFVAKMITPIGNSDDRANAAAIAPNYKIIAAGYSDNGSNNDFALVRYSLHATVDASFGVNGKVTTDFGGNDEATAVAVQADYKILVAGKTSTGGGAALVLARYNDNGSLDTSFGTGGRVIVPAIQNPKAILIQSYGKIIVAGNAPHGEPPFGDNFAVARFNPNGSLDASFDGDGIAVTRFDHSSQINSVAMQGGKIVAAGFTRNKFGTIFEFALARYNANGSLDTTFDADGKVTTSFGTSYNIANAVGVQRNGKIIAVGVSINDTTYGEFAFARYNLTGALDTTFDTDGRQTTDFFGSDDDAFAATIQGDGMIVAAGSAGRGSKFDFATARHWGDPVAATHPTQFDFDADSKTDISIFRPVDNKWYVAGGADGFTSMTWGQAGDLPVPADYDGDGLTDIAVFRPSTGTWFIVNSSSGAFVTYNWGADGDLPVPADHNADGKADLVLFRQSNGMFYRRYSDSSYHNVSFGVAGDKPVIGDFDSDGRFDIGVYRPSNNNWYIRKSTAGLFVQTWGEMGDIPVPADYDGDGQTDLAVWRPSNGRWYRAQSTVGFDGVNWGQAGDKPIPADYDGDGKADVAIFRPSTGTWYMIGATTGISQKQFGQNGDVPTPSAFIY